jgi:uncharacterized membrane protein YbaN (DUF454 family)
VGHKHNISVHRLAFAIDSQHTIANSNLRDGLSRTSLQLHGALARKARAAIIIVITVGATVGCSGDNIVVVIIIVITVIIIIGRTCFKRYA